LFFWWIYKVITSSRRRKLVVISIGVLSIYVLGVISMVLQTPSIPPMRPDVAGINEKVKQKQTESEIKLQENTVAEQDKPADDSKNEELMPVEEEIKQEALANTPSPQNPQAQEQPVITKPVIQPSKSLGTAPSPQPDQISSSYKYNHNGNNYNCDDFQDWASANEAFLESIAATGYDIHHLDGRGNAIEDRIPCETLQGAP
jgi:hypothetical protein